MFTMRTYERCTRRLTQRALSGDSTFKRWQSDARSVRLVNRRAVREGLWPLRKSRVDALVDAISDWLV